MRRDVGASGLGIAAFLLSMSALGQGSNLGGYGVQLQPGAIAGKVTGAGGVPVSGARVETTAGHFVYTDAAGAYVLYVDAPGIYDVKVTTASRLAGPLQVSVTLGATTALDFTSFRARPRPRRNLPAATPARPGARP